MSWKPRFSDFLLPMLLIAWGVSFFLLLGWKPGFAYNAQRYFQILLIGCLLCAAVTLPVRFEFGRFWAKACAALLVLILLVVSQAENTWLAVREAMQYLSLFAAILVVAKTRELSGSQSFDQAVFFGLAVFCFGCSLIVMEGLLLSLSIQTVDQRIIFGAFINVRTFAALQIMTLLILPAAWLLANSSSRRIFVGVVAVFWWGLLLFTGTRTALIALPLALILMALVTRRNSLRWFKVLSVQFVGGVLVFIGLRFGNAWFLDKPFWAEGGLSFVRISTGGRLDLWSDSWSHFLEHPWLGNGPGGFACFTTELVATPHNLFFQLLSEWGGLFTLLSVALALVIFFAMIEYLRSRFHSSPLHFSLFASLVAVIAASMVDGVIIGPLQQMVLVLVFGWALHAFSPEKFVVTKSGDRSSLQIVSVVVLAVVLAVVLWGVEKDLQLQRQLLVSPDGTVNLSYGPRFWADGHDRCPDWHERYENRTK
jgi:O-antigen ligase